MNNNISFCITPNWPAPSKVKALTTTRNYPGLSTHPYDKCNLGANSGEDLSIVAANRIQLYKNLQIANEPIWLTQEHTNTVVYATQNILTTAPVADAAYTNIPQIACVALTADCVPILLCDYDATIVVAIHAGWKGLVAGVIENTLETIGYDGSKLMAWLGPAISANAFIVDDSVRDTFIAIDPAAKSAFQPYNNKWQCDLYLLAKQRLRAHGVSAIYGGEYCTYADKDLFYSYRRDNGVTGRMATMIWLA